MFSIFQEHWRCAEDLRHLFDRIPPSTWHCDASPIPTGGQFRDLPHTMGRRVEVLRREEYLHNSLDQLARTSIPKDLARRVYYFIRPTLPVGIRKYMQRLALRGWDRRSFPAWPVDTTVDNLLRDAWRPLLREAGVDRLPFIWFWPDGHRYAGILTHDVETAVGRDFCSELMRMEAKHSIVSSFEVVPEERYEVTPSYLSTIRDGGCEVCLHGLNHDGQLFATRQEFERRAIRINEYAVRFRAIGFRSPVMYRQLEWIDELAIEYDMSVPNVAHLDPQRGGCCTVFPYFLGRVLELPLTTTQDYTLYNILGRCDLELWRRQVKVVRENHGLLSFIIHPDYTIRPSTQKLYQDLLCLLAQERDHHDMWLPLPGELNQWWRQRHALRLVHEDGQWQIQGQGAERAKLAYAVLTGDNIHLELENQA